MTEDIRFDIDFANALTALCQEKADAGSPACITFHLMAAVAVTMPRAGARMILEQVYDDADEAMRREREKQHG